MNMKINKPVRLYVDSIESDGLAAQTSNPLSVTFDLHSINYLRSSYVDKPISIEDESPVLLAGKYVCIKMAVFPNTMKLLFFEPRDNSMLITTMMQMLTPKDKDILSLIIEYIGENASEIVNDVELVVGQPKGATLQ